MGIEPTTYGLRNRCRVRENSLNRSIFAHAAYAICTLRTRAGHSAAPAGPGAPARPRDRCPARCRRR